MLQAEVVEKVSTHILCSVTFFFFKLCHLWDNVGKNGRAGWATDDNIIWCMCIACQITKASRNTCWYYL